MAPRSDFDLTGFKIPARAWYLALAFIVLAGVAMLAVPGPAVRGCFFAKSCSAIPQAPFYFAVLTIAMGAWVSTWLGGVPRGWVVGWTATIAAIATIAIVAAPLVLTLHKPFGDDLRNWMLPSVLTACVFWIVQIPVALVASLVPSPVRARVVATTILREDRPMWLREVAATLASIESTQTTWLDASESQVVAELVFTLEADRNVPAAVLQHTKRMRSLLARGEPSRQALVLELMHAANVDATEHPYRGV